MIANPQFVVILGNALAKCDGWLSQTVLCFSLACNLWLKTSVSSSTISRSNEGRQGVAAESLLLQARQEQK